MVTYTYDKNVNLILKSEVLPLGTVVTTYTWKINNINQNSNTPNLEINTTTNLNEGSNTVSLVVVCEHGTVSNEYVVNINVGTPPIGTKYKCSGYPNYDCVPVTDPNDTSGRIFDSKEECEILCKSISPTLRATLTSISPTEAKVGQEVEITLTGSNFNTLAYANFYRNNTYVDHGSYISGNETSIKVKRKFTTVETMTVKVNNRNQTLSNSLPFNVLPNDVPVTPSLKVVATPSTIIKETPTDIVFNVKRTDNNSPVEGVIVTLSGASTNTGTTLTDGNVTMNINSTSLGTITVVAEKVGFNRGTSSITVTSQPPTQNPVKIQVNKTISITVTDTVTNMPVQNVSVESNNETKLTDSQGKVTFN